MYGIIIKVNTESKTTTDQIPKEVFGFFFHCKNAILLLADETFIFLKKIPNSQQC